MKNLFVFFTSIVLVFGVSKAVVAQDGKTAEHQVNITVPTIAIVDIEAGENGTTAINLTPNVDNLEAGNAVNFSSATNSSLWLNYTSVVVKNQSRSITAEYSGILPAGVSLKLKASTTSTGTGTLGTGEEEITLDKNANDLISGIGSCFTGNGYESGHQLTYTLDMDNKDYKDLLAGDQHNLVVTFTITD